MIRQSREGEWQGDNVTGEGRWECVSEAGLRKRRVCGRNERDEVVAVEQGNIGIDLDANERLISGDDVVLHTKPKPFSLSSSRMMLSRFRYTTPGRDRSRPNTISKLFTCVFESTFL